MKTNFSKLSCKVLVGFIVICCLFNFTSCGLKQTLTLNSGNGWFYVEDETEDGLKEFVCEFTPGQTLGEILEKNDFPGYSVWVNEDKNIRYSYNDGDDYYRQSGLYIDENGDYYGDDDVLTETISLSSDYSKYFQVTFDLNGGNVDGNTAAVKKWVPDFFKFVGEEFAPPAAEKEGYTLVGWSETKNGTQNVDHMPSKNVILYAMWEQN